METQGIKELVGQINKFLGKQMKENLNNGERIKKIREDKVIEVTVHGQTTRKVSIEGLEDTFRKQGEQRVTIPSQDILQHNAKFLLHETSNDFLKKLSDQYKENVKIAELKIKEKESLIEEQLSKK